MTTDKQFKNTAARRRLATETTEVSQDCAAMIAGLVAGSRGKFTDREFDARLERGGQEYAEYLRDGR
ncbi:hypothetical protein [Streptomyces sp. NPDC047065]|uniref:hypothetical protein n=1 Tax=Streptomyces sp. NPDC047065 TaxID=3154606 RepID=UPI0033D30852